MQGGFRSEFRSLTVASFTAQSYAITFRPYLTFLWMGLYAMKGLMSLIIVITIELKLEHFLTTGAKVLVKPGVVMH